MACHVRVGERRCRCFAGRPPRPRWDCVHHHRGGRRQHRLGGLAYGELADHSKRLATALAELGIERGDTVGVLMGKRSELVIALIAIARLGAVYLPLFTAFAGPAIEMRLRAGGARVVLTQPSQVHELNGLDVTTIGAGEQFNGVVAESDLLANSVAVGGDEPLVLLFTCGTS